MYKIYDYDRNTFKKIVNNAGKYNYYIKINKKYIEVSKEVYLVLLRSYGKIKYNRKREVAKSVQYYSDMDLATSFIFNRKNSVDFIHQIYVKDLANKAIEEIYKLSDKFMLPRKETERLIRWSKDFSDFLEVGLMYINAKE